MKRRREQSKGFSRFKLSVPAIIASMIFVVNISSAENKAVLNVDGQKTGNQLKDLQSENARLKEAAVRRDKELASIQSALASAASRLRMSEEDRQKLAAEMGTIKAQLVAVQMQSKVVSERTKNELLTLADKGEAVFFNGVGEAQMAALNDRTVLRFPLSAADSADKVFMGVKAERYLYGAFAYYIVDSQKLAL